MILVLDGDKKLEWLRSFGLFRLEKKKWIRTVSIYLIIYSNNIVEQRFVPF